MAKPRSSNRSRERRLEEPRKRLAPHQIGFSIPEDSASRDDVERAKLQEIVDVLWLPKGLDEHEMHVRIARAVDLLHSLAPKDGVEAMLAAQMIGTHNAALECLRRAMVPSQTFEGRNANLAQAQRLMSLYTQQLAALDKHRGKGQQKITVERVEVAAGGQAIVGNVEAGAAQPMPSAAPLAALEAPREDTVPLPPARSRSRAKR